MMSTRQNKLVERIAYEGSNYENDAAEFKTQAVKIEAKGVYVIIAPIPHNTIALFESGLAANKECHKRYLDREPQEETELRKQLDGYEEEGAIFKIPFTYNAKKKEIVSDDEFKEVIKLREEINE